MTTFMGVWPVVDDQALLDALKVEALDAVATLAWEQGCVVYGEPEWTVVEGWIEGYPSPSDLYLICRAPARRRRRTS